MTACVPRAFRGLRREKETPLRGVAEVFGDDRRSAPVEGARPHARARRREFRVGVREMGGARPAGGFMRDDEVSAAFCASRGSAGPCMSPRGPRGPPATLRPPPTRETPEAGGFGRTLRHRRRKACRARRRISSAMDSGDMYRLPAVRSSPVSSIMTPTRRTMASSSGKIPAALVRRSTSRSTRRSGLVEQIFV